MSQSAPAPPGLTSLVFNRVGGVAGIPVADPADGYRHTGTALWFGCHLDPGSRRDVVYRIETTGANLDEIRQRQSAPRPRRAISKCLWMSVRVLWMHMAMRLIH
jgi:hypothetical protein